MSDRDINIKIPESLFQVLEERAKGQGVSIEALCLSLLQDETNKIKTDSELIDPVLYRSITSEDLRKEIHKVLQSKLSSEEIKRRVRILEVTITRFMK